MRYLVAVSGGIDSVVLLDRLVQSGEHELIVAHFDHGIRPDSAADARFVEALARRYGLPFVTKREELGGGAGEELARTRRYAFLRAEAQKLQARLVTAHHSDDVIETVAINSARGTGWRGLAVLDAPDITRPLLTKTKQEIRDYALEHRLEWVEDSTNMETKYLRNQVRRKVALLVPYEGKRTILNAWQRQLRLKREIQEEAARLLEQNGGSRYFFTQCDLPVAIELLRLYIRRESGVTITRPQAQRTLVAIKTAKPGSLYDVGEGVGLQFTARTFIVKTP
ncbi:MAG TPA: tRNA lysidine(34) synthetase TilS [Verrucomicrobiae bacterium]|jgi:tRNA(Ile)-lysidine synthetase-like protein|nr:tRNA lysidine(34) synthetase TilS [Verrucomicrobiae bacterium]